MKLVFYFLAFLMMPNLIFSQQQNVTLKQCRDSAKINWPNFKKIALQEQNLDIITSTLNKNYLPKLTLSGSAMYQSEVVVFPEIDVPGLKGFFPTLPHDNYRTDLQLQQIIYDGGNTKSAKDLQIAASQLDETQVEIENYNLMEQINQLYLNILLLDQNNNILLTAKSEITENIKFLQSAYNNGTVLISELNKIIAEKLKIDKQLLDTKTSRINLIQSLASITGIDIYSETIFQAPREFQNTPTTIPQLRLFTAQQGINKANLAMEFRAKFPKLSFFANGGYGRPGYNFMDTKLHPYGIVGVNLSWNIIDWGTYTKQQEKNIINQKIIDASKEVFVKQNNLEIQKIKNDINNIRDQIVLDAKIIELKVNVKNSSWSKLKNGTITSNDYLKDFNDLKIAQQALEINRIKLIQKEITLNHLIGVQY